MPVQVGSVGQSHFTVFEPDSVLAMIRGGNPHHFAAGSLRKTVYKPFIGNDPSRLRGLVEQSLNARAPRVSAEECMAVFDGDTEAVEKVLSKVGIENSVRDVFRSIQEYTSVSDRGHWAAHALRRLGMAGVSYALSSLQSEEDQIRVIATQVGQRRYDFARLIMSERASGFGRRPGDYAERTKVVVISRNWEEINRKQRVSNYRKSCKEKATQYRARAKGMREGKVLVRSDARKSSRTRLNGIAALFESVTVNDDLEIKWDETSAKLNNREVAFWKMKTHCELEPDLSSLPAVADSATMLESFVEVQRRLTNLETYRGWEPAEFVSALETATRWAITDRNSMSSRMFAIERAPERRFESTRVRTVAKMAIPEPELEEKQEKPQGRLISNPFGAKASFTVINPIKSEDVVSRLTVDQVWDFIESNPHLSPWMYDVLDEDKPYEEKVKEAIELHADEMNELIAESGWKPYDPSDKPLAE